MRLTHVLLRGVLLCMYQSEEWDDIWTKKRLAFVLKELLATRFLRPGSLIRRSLAINIRFGMGTFSSTGRSLGAETLS